MNLSKTAIAVSLALVSLSAGSAPMPSDERIEAEMRNKVAFPTDSAIDLKGRELTPERERALASKPYETQTVPDVSADGFLINAQPADKDAARKATTNILEMVDRIKGKGIEAASPEASELKEELYVFLSFSMPDYLIKQYLEQAAAYGAKVAFRGSVNGDLRFGPTQQRIRALKPRKYPEVEINPVAFKRYGISRVPAFAIGKYSNTPGTDSNGCLPPEKYAAISGDISVPYALKEMVKKGPKDLRPIATKFLSGES